jgi:Uma2 family endonuclease
MNAVLTRPITLEEFEALPAEQTERMEVVRGEMVEKMSPGLEHSQLQGRILYLLLSWAYQADQGFVGPEASYVLEATPLTLRTPDVSYWSKEKHPLGKLPKTFGHFPPDLAVEIISPSERPQAVQAKVYDYLTAGVALIWTVYPDERQVIVYTQENPPRTLRRGDLLQFPEILPGFACRVEDLFPPEG